MQGVSLKYSHEEEGAGVVQLLLKTDGTFLYNKNTSADQQISEGKWVLKKEYITLNSTLQKNNIPIKLNYGNNGDFVDDLNIAVVKNIRNLPLTDAFVFVNNDSTKCLPLMGRCNCLFKTIKKVKVVFENGLSSKWISVKKKKPQNITHSII